MQINFHLPEACAASSEEKRQRTGERGLRKEPPRHQPAVRIWLQPSLEQRKRGTARARERKDRSWHESPATEQQEKSMGRKEQAAPCCIADIRARSCRRGRKDAQNVPSPEVFCCGWRLRSLGALQEPTTGPKNANEGGYRAGEVAVGHPPAAQHPHSARGTFLPLWHGHL